MSPERFRHQHPERLHGVSGVYELLILVRGPAAIVVDQFVDQVKSGVQMMVKQRIDAAIRDLLQCIVVSHRKHLSGGPQKNHPHTLHTSTGKGSSPCAQISRTNVRVIVRLIISSDALQDYVASVTPILPF